jgi:hypothetical protein
MVVINIVTSLCKKEFVYVGDEGVITIRIAFHRHVFCIRK